MTDKYTDYIFKCKKTGLKIIRPDINLDTVKDGRGYVSTYFPEDDIKELKNVSDDNPNIIKKIESIILNARTTPSLEKFKIKALDN